jgi:outer membrane protein assembly factor BamB
VKTYPIFITGDREPFFRDLLLDVNTRGQEFTARDPFGRALWKVSLESQSQYVSSVGNRAVVTDHFVVVSVGTQLVAIDPLGTADSPGARVLWRQPLTEVASASVVPMAAGIRRMRNPWSEFSGILGPVTRDYVCFQRGRKLFVVDPLTGRPVWTRDGIPTGGELLGDDELVISISPDDDATVFRALDGRELVSRRVPSGTSNFRREAFGRSLLLWGQVRDEQTLSRYDIWADRYVWIRRFAPKSHYRMVGVDEVAVLEPEGKFTIVGLADGDVRFQATADPEPNLAEIIVQRTPEQYLLIANVPLVLQGNARGGRIQSYSELVNGRLYGFERPTGRRLWSTSVERQWMDPYDSPRLPVLITISQTTEPVPNTNGLVTRSNLVCVDRRNGRIVYDQPTPETTYSIEVQADPDLKQVELKMSRSTVKLTFTDKPVPE